jgi:hypothetical protein
MAVTWRAVLGGAYEASEDGRIRRAKPGRGRTFVGRVLRPHANNKGYATISVWENGKRRRYLVHALVAEAFIGRRPWGFDVDHVDGNILHNGARNLEYVSHSENIRRGYVGKRGGRHPLARVSDEDATRMKARRFFGERGVDLSREYGISQQLVCGITKGRSRPWL